LHISIITAPDTDIIKISTNLHGSKGCILRASPKGTLPILGIKIDAVMIKNELKKAKISHLFLKMPTLKAGYIVDLEAKDW